MEFALIAPVLVLLLLGVYEICNAAIVYEEVQNSAHAIPIAASNLATQGNGATELTYQQIQLVASEIWAEIPELENGFEDGAKYVTISSVTFVKTYPNTPSGNTNPTAGQYCTPVKGPPQVLCQYTPTVVWSVTYTGGDSKRTFLTGTADFRSCSTTTPTDAANVFTGSGTATAKLPGALNNNYPPTTSLAPVWAVSDLTSLPTAVVANPDPFLAAPSPILVVDVHLHYTPIFGLFINSSGLDFNGTGFYPVRSVQSATTQTTGTVTTTVALTLSQQFTTLYDSATPIPGAAAGTYCINTSSLLPAPAQS
jgi:Flp pilus assembly protein TadG